MACATLWQESWGRHRSMSHLRSCCGEADKRCAFRVRALLVFCGVFAQSDRFPWHAVCRAKRGMGQEASFAYQIDTTAPETGTPEGLIQAMLEMKNAVTRDLYCYWDGLRDGLVVPDRAEVDPGAIRRVLADTFIVEVDADRAFPYRLAGSRLCALMGHELRGESFLDAFMGPDRVEMERLIDAVIVDSAAVVVGLEARSNQGHRLDLELLMMPLRHRSAANSRILGSIAPSEQPFWIAVCPIETVCVRSVRVLWPSGRSMFNSPQPPSPPPGARRLAHLTVVDGGRN